MIVLCKKLKGTFQQPVVQTNECLLDPARAITGSTPTLLSVLSKFSYHFMSEDIELIDNELRSLILYENATNIYQENTTTTEEQFWSKIGKIKKRRKLQI